jgi:protein-L-isoaspartate O-methyltransferase
MCRGGARRELRRRDWWQDFRSGPGIMILFALTIFLGAFLLFQVQPMMAKFILPWFGGGPGVWTTCLLFFQACLLAGYAYAHAVSRFFSRRTQACMHVALLLAALVFLPIVPGAHWKPGADADPTWGILLLLTVCLGLPYLVLASTGPLLQAWFSRLQPGVVPYRLYALSNAGSLLALVSYPFVFEPVLTRRTQAGLWAWSFGAFVLLCGACAWQVWRARPKDGASAEIVLEPPAQSSEGCPPTAAVKAWWFGLPACGSVLLLATTNKLCLDVAAIPFLWMLPLSLYLLTFIVCFDRPSWYDRKIFTLLLMPLLIFFCHALWIGSQVSLWRQVVVYCGSLFVGCMVCHGEVYRLRPAPRFLTSFYLFIAAGGAAGGVFVGIVSPLVFHSYAELNWGFWLLAALVLGIHLHEKTEVRWQNRRWRLWPVMLAGVVALGGVMLLQARRGVSNTVYMSRNFYGVLQVIELEADLPMQAYKLYHGDITHGLQFTDPGLSILATTYYNEPSGVGMALNNFQRQTNRCVGVVGLGTGTLAVYGRAGDTFRFYEINPEVRRLADTRFTFLKNSNARVEVVLGDARLSLEREPAQQFDVLVLDAFSSDAIPVHLLTQEAFETYFRHLKPDGAIAVHISNRHLNLLPVMVGLAKHFQTMMLCIEWDEKSRPWWFSSSKWVILSRNEPFMLSQPLLSRATIMPDRDAENAILWTDDYASLFSIVRP